jgi:hypothetical protein
LRSARERRDERVEVDVSFDIDEPLMLLLLFIELPDVPVPELVELPVLLVPLVDPVELLPVVSVPLVPVPVELLPVVPVPLLVDDPVVPPVAVPLERFVPLLFIELPVEPVDPVVPAFGPEVEVLLLGEPDAPPWPPPALVPAPVPVPPAPPVPCARAPPHASAAAAESARILKVCLMRYS